MTALAIFGVCIATVVALVLLLVIIAGGNSLLLVIIFPAVIAEAITGESGFDFKNKSIVHMGLFYLFILMQVVAIAAVFFGAYCLFFGFPIATAEAAIAAVPNIDYLLILNKVLLALVSYFVLLFAYYAIKYRKNPGQLKGFRFFQFRVVPVITYSLALIYLLACHQYLMSFPGGDPIGFLPKIASFVYVPYLVYLLIKTVIDYSHILHNGLSQFGFTHWLNLLLGLFYNISFVYFFYQINFVLSLSS